MNALDSLIRGFFVIVAGLFGTIAHADETAKPWIAQIVHEETSAADQKSWYHQSFEVRRGSLTSGLTVGGKLEAFERSGQRNQTISFNLIDSQAGKSFRRLELLGGPKTTFRPRASIEVEIGQVKTGFIGEEDSLVWSITGRHATYRDLSILNLGMAFEYYPKQFNGWLSGALSQSWVGDNLIGPSSRLRIDYNLTEQIRVYALGARGLEPDQRGIITVSGLNLGLVSTITDRIEIDFSVGEEERSHSKNRRSLSVAIARKF